MPREMLCGLIVRSLGNVDSYAAPPVLPNDFVGSYFHLGDAHQAARMPQYLLVGLALAVPVNGRLAFPRLQRNDRTRFVHAPKKLFIDTAGLLDQQRRSAPGTIRAGTLRGRARNRCGGAEYLLPYFIFARKHYQSYCSSLSLIYN